MSAIVYGLQSIASGSFLDVKPSTAGDEWMIRKLLIGGLCDVALTNGTTVLTYRRGMRNTLSGLALPANQSFWPRITNQSGASTSFGYHGELMGSGVTAGAVGAIQGAISSLTTTTPVAIQPSLNGGGSNEWLINNLFCDGLALIELTDGTNKVPLTPSNSWLGSLEHFSLPIRNNLYLQITKQDAAASINVGYTGIVSGTAILSGASDSVVGAISSVAASASLAIQPSASTTQWNISHLLINSPTLSAPSVTIQYVLVGTPNVTLSTRKLPDTVYGMAPYVSVHESFQVGNGFYLNIINNSSASLTVAYLGKIAQV